MSTRVHGAIPHSINNKKPKTFAEICDISDNNLFTNITRNPHHILNQLLPSDHANISLHVSLLLTLFTEIFIMDVR